MACRPKPPGYWRGSHLCALLAAVGLMLVDGCANYGNKAFRLGDGVASAHPAIIDGHSGIFSGPFIDFLTSYIGFIEGKEYQLTAEGRQSKHTSPQEH